MSRMEDVIVFSQRQFSLPAVNAFSGDIQMGTLQLQLSNALQGASFFSNEEEKLELFQEPRDSNQLEKAVEGISSGTDGRPKDENEVQSCSAKRIPSSAHSTLNLSLIHI
eukprot:TRINITY_DN11397_c0_g1_i3.p1 TRINITY_DN11397_c0_g1~~TRINITY_DN11397_c0_g1_i3.p1  ORF type:complete len:110 (-),score=15.78 TRINITY_DN11397_c0_g1_i3:59-388(-)